MPKKITHITEEHLARTGEWVKKWVAIGLSTEPADFERAEAAALRAYDLCHLDRPTVVLRMGSPYGAVLGGLLALRYLGSQVSSQVSSQVESQVRFQVGSQVSSQVSSQIESQVESQVWSQVGSQVSSQVRFQVESQVRFQVGSHAIKNSYLGSLWASWVAYVSFFRDVLGWTDPILNIFTIDEDLMSCGWVWWHENVLAISDRPRFLRLDDAGRLHNESGPSIAYSDGWSLWHWHGVPIPEAWITDRSHLTPQMALGETNIERRRAACEIVGWDRILSEMKGKSIDLDADEQIGELIEVNLPDAGPSRFLRVLCATGRRFAIPVPLVCRTALEANAWTYNIPSSLMQQKENRT